MRYLLMACTDEEATGALSLDERSAVVAEYMALAEEMGSRGVLLSGEQLRPTWDATTVRVRDGEVLMADGPLRRDQGADGRVHGDRVRRRGRGHRGGVEAPRGALGDGRGATDLAAVTIAVEAAVARVFRGIAQGGAAAR
ncbi:MAG TPA: hypothetical protein VE466_05650 [Acidimicrobiales bacterium]|jgi:hypothetical protein|nr:hypothetical protein [Acidimicrobiales bacterium]